MSKIKLFGLGGLNENGKDMFVIEVDNDIFVMEAGLKYADESMLGIDYMIPNIDYLKKNKERIKGIFLTHGHDENVGALTDIYESLDNVKVYGSKFTIDFVTNEFETHNYPLDNLVTVSVNKELSFGKVKIVPISFSHSIPDNFGYAIYTPDGVIFYTSDFVFDAMMKGHYKTDLGRLAYVGRQNVLCLLTESLYAAREGFTSPHHRISKIIRETLSQSDGRIVFNVLSSHLYRIQELFNEVSKTNRKIVIMGKRLQSVINYALENKYLYINQSFIGDLSNINDSNVVILNSNEREKPYSNMIRIINGYDKYVKLNENDTVFLAMPVYEGREKTFSKMLDDLAKIGCEIVTLPPKKYLSHHASSEDLMQMIDLTKPKYYFPMKGEYRYQVANGDLAANMGIPRENIILKENGDVAIIENGQLLEDTYRVECGVISIDGESSDDVGEVVLRDRELLANNGIIIVTATVNKKDKKLVGGPEILTRGFIYIKDSADLINEIKTICHKIIIDNTKPNYIEYNKIKNTIRDELSRFLSNQTGNKPMIITVIQEI